ncbi:MAG TPA: L-threonylcarbamoyladenylate synthase [Pirellulales bacterium]|nr:L-threonylcarbamoyladenylate synthase [Pirellulales bacterium]
MPPLVIDVRSAEDTRDCIHRAVQALAEGKLVAFPTETVYALATSALNEAAVGRMLKTKRRPAGQPPLTLGIKSADEALDYVPQMTPLGQRLARRCWPGPVTIVCANHNPESLLNRLPEGVRKAVTPTGTVGLRVPGHKLFLDTMKLIVGPVALSSANRAGQPDPLTAQEVVAGLGDDVALVLDDGRTRFGQSSSVIKIGDRGFEVIRGGVVSEQTLSRLACFSIVFVCTGNTCRSPMAEALCRNMLAARLHCSPDELQDRGVTISSAGISATMGGRPSPEAVAVLSEIGVDLSHHESQPLAEQLVRHADIIWTMTRGHRQAILSQWPEAGSRVHLLSMDGQDIPDPIGCSEEQYRRCAEQIKAELDSRLKDLEL